ncbi:MAG: hypothetical protein Sapg2KO_28750 [Saprospiraceae bacterium]
MRQLLSFLLLFSCTFGYSQQVDLSSFHGLQPRNIGPAGMSGRVTAIEVQLSDPDNILIGAAAGGVWQSTNAGHTWTPIFDNELAASIGDIKMYQANPDIIYVASGEGNPRNSQNSGWGMFKSIDGGKNWQHLGLENTRQIHRILIHPDNPDHVVIGVSGATWGTSKDRGIYKTTDGGKTWKKMLYINETTGCADLVVDPSNPNHMLATMWEHQRWPWFFNSGGNGSGMYQSHDGGDTWEKVTKGLPKGTLGRMGLSFAPSKPDIVYAYVESKTNAIYRSEDGGLSWAKRSKDGDRNIGGRPFYYADIYTDTQNENRLYSIASEVTMSEDGGKTWSVFAAGNKLHTDHHAWWAHPTDNEFLMVGHDGGLNITQDRGKNWWFADNLPLAQFYHIRVDNEVPYNIMGGLQDNGSWVGPSQVRFKGGIRNYYWQRVSVGDGFDVVPDPLDPDYGYSMGQAGGLLRYHRPSGQLNIIKPVHPRGEYLRFNWNAGIGINPFDQKTIYYGSQYLLKSSDLGKSWDIISPDLTTNDTSKQNFLESGGLSYDATGAENHTTIISIAPSSLEKGLIWVGTDDGKVQLTKNEGGSWEDLTSNIPGVPAGNWVTQIQASKHKAGEAFVVFDDHRRNNWDAYVFRTQNYGKTWERIVDNKDVRGFAYCIEQDPVEPNLLFCGTEFGLYVSFDAGKEWNKWTQGYPTVPTTDLVIHPRDHDLVIGTFGRSIWILDDIRPLREMAKQGVKKGMNQGLIAFTPAPAYLFNIGESIGYRAGKVGDSYYNGENRAYGALISYYLKEKRSGNSKADFADEVKITIKNASGKVVRTLYNPAKPGLNRMNWGLERNAPRSFRSPKPTKPTKPRGGKGVVPGKYTVEVAYQGLLQKTSIEVLKDPLIKISQAEMEEKSKWLDRLDESNDRVTKVMDQIRTYESDLAYFKKAVVGQDKFNLIIKDTEAKLNGFRERIQGRQAQGILGQPHTIASMLGAASYQLQGPLVPITMNQKNALEQVTLKISALEKDFASYQSIFIPQMKTAIKQAGIKLFEK